MPIHLVEERLESISSACCSKVASKSKVGTRGFFDALISQPMWCAALSPILQDCPPSMAIHPNCKQTSRLVLLPFHGHVVYGSSTRSL